MEKARLDEQYYSEISPELKKSLGLQNVMQVPKISKIVLNVGVKGAESKDVQIVEDILEKLAGQRPIRTVARKSIAGFKLREGMPIGAKVTLRRKRMYEFLDRLIATALPTVRDFQGVSPRFDRRGNYNLGIKEWTIFPEVGYDVAGKIFGMNITIHTTTTKDEHAYELLKSFGMPFRKSAS